MTVEFIYSNNPTFSFETSLEEAFQQEDFDEPVGEIALSPEHPSEAELDASFGSSPPSSPPSSTPSSPKSAIHHLSDAMLVDLPNLSEQAIVDFSYLSYHTPPSKIPMEESHEDTHRGNSQQRHDKKKSKKKRREARAAERKAQKAEPYVVKETTLRNHVDGCKPATSVFTMDQMPVTKPGYTAVRGPPGHIYDLGHFLCPEEGFMLIKWDGRYAPHLELFNQHYSPFL